MSPTDLGGFVIGLPYPAKRGQLIEAMGHRGRVVCEITRKEFVDALQYYSHSGPYRPGTYYPDTKEFKQGTSIHSDVRYFYMVRIKG